MNIEKKNITVAGMQVEVVRKDIKNLHLGVYPPHGRVRVAVPMVVSDEAVRLAVLDKLTWIKRQKVKFMEQPRESPREMVSGESHYYLGRRYRLRVTEQSGKGKVALHGITYMDLFIEPGTTREQREALLLKWYREQLNKLIPALLEKWQPLLGVQALEWGIKRMKTKWGSCNREARRVWFNLELAKKPVHCLEYIVAHELVHLLERTHSDRFVALMNQHFPGWQLIRAELQEGLLSHQAWGE